MCSSKQHCEWPGGGGGGGTPLFGLYGDVPLDRVWFFGLAVLNRVYNLTCFSLDQVKTCPKQGMVLRELTLKCKLKCYFKAMNNPLGVSPSKGKQGTTRGKEKIF